MRTSGILSMLVIAAIATAQGTQGQGEAKKSIPATKIIAAPGQAPVSGPGPEAMVGKKAEFTMTGIDGKTYTSKSLRGKVVLVDFWATWCGPCKMASPTIQKLHEKWASKGVVIIGANTSERDSAGKIVKNAERAAAYSKEHSYSYLFTWGNDDLKNRWNVRGIPTFFIIDTEGIIKGVQVGYGPSLEKMLEQKIQPLVKR